MKNQTDSRFHNSLLLAAFGFLIIFSFIATDYYFNYDSAKVSALENASPKSYEREKRFQRFLTLLGQQLHSIRNFPDFSNFLEGKVSKDHAENYFLNIAQTQGNIMQLRYLDASGHERIRVDQLAANTFKTFKIKDLQDKSHRDYFIEGKTKPIDQVWYSKVDLNIEQGVVEVPFKPTLRVIMPLGKDGQFNGMLVMNVYMQGFIDELMRMPLYSPVLLNADGEILWHSDAELNWSAYQQKPFTIFKFYPQLTSVLDKSKPYKDSDRFVRRLDLPLAQDLYLWFEVNPVYLQAERVRYQQSLTVVSAFVALFTFLAILFFSKLNARLYDQVLRSKAQFEAMFKKHSAVMLLIDPDNGDIKEANTSACKFYGYSPEQFSKKNIQSLNEIDQANLPETLSKLQGAGTEPYHFVHRLSNGEYRDVDVDASLIDTEDGNLIFEIIKDVTQEKKNKANLKEILSRMALASEVANFGVWQWNYESGELVWDKQMHRIYGVPESQEVDRYQQWHDAVHSDDIASAEEKINLAAKGDVDFMTEFRIIRPSGEVRTILAVGRSQRDEQGVPTSMVGINMDITKQKLLEIQARQERSIADTIIDHAPMIIALVNSKGVMVRLNHYGEKFVGFTQDEVSKEAYFWSRFIPKSLRSKVTEFVQSAQSGQLPPKFINPWIGKDGHERTFEWTNLSLNDEASNGNYILAIGVDISEEEAIKENLLVSVKNAEQSNNLKSEFLANMSHEIRTPLNGIIGLTNLMLKTPLNLQQRDYIEQSLQSSKTLLRILNDILDYSKIEANRLDLDVQAFSLEQILQNSISLFSYAANQKGLELHIDLSTDLYISMLGDSLRIEQIFNNLLGNAIKFTNEGDITIQAFARSVTESDAEIEFRVMDTGIGIPEEKVQHLFEAFNQADTSYTRKYGFHGFSMVSKQL
ncbi:hypothetical protein THIOSC13_220053 [uncultured Thiomicrorhabdus sp.]